MGLEEYAEYATLRYGTDVVVNRAIPDYRDGLKPVQRAILWSMYNLRLHHSGPYKKAARVVGDCLGQYHPHGDCLRADTQILLLSGERITIRELCDTGAGSKWVLAYSETTHELVPALAHSWREGKRTLIMYRVLMSTAEVIEVTGNHKFYNTTTKNWISADCLSPGTFLAGGTFLHPQHCREYALNGQMTVCSVERIELEQVETFYDFTVDGYENMVVLTSNGKETGNFIVAHNSATYLAMAGLVNTPIPIIDGYGNWGSHIEKPAAMRYSMRGDTKIATEYGLIMIQDIPRFLNLTVNSDIIDINIKVPSINGHISQATKWMYNGERDCYTVTTKSGRQISSTQDHKFYVFNKLTRKAEFLRLGSIVVGDILYVQTQDFNFDKPDFAQEYALDYESFYMRDPITLIEYDGVHHVYDLSVLSTNAFVANGIIVHNCFVSGTKIMTEHGLVEIQDIPKITAAKQERPHTLTEVPIKMTVMSSGEQALATKWLYSGKHPTFKLKTKLGYSVQCTGNEPFLILNKNLEYEWMPLSQLKVGDTICLTGEFNGFSVKETGLTRTEASILASMTKAIINTGNKIIYSDPIAGRFNSVRNALVRLLYRTLDETDFAVTDYEKDAKFFVAIDSRCPIFARFGVMDWNEYTSFVPNIVFSSSLEVVAAYCRNIFSMYTRIVGTDYYLSSRSRSLLTDLKILLLNYFGVVTDEIIQSDNGHLLLLIFDVDLCRDKHLIHQSTAALYDSRHTEERLSKIKNKTYDVIPHISNYIENEYIEAIASGEYSEDQLQKIRSLSNHSSILCNQLDFESMPDSPVLDRISAILDKQYTYDIIVDVVSCPAHDVFDLTVEGTHAFVANGFIVHNTEARLSKFADTVLLDPEYLAVAEMRPNYSEDKLLPTVLPSKLPNMLLAGHSSIAVGVSASSPPFALNGVLELTKLCLDGRQLTNANCQRYLKFNYKYGGNCISSKADLSNLYATGKGTLLFEPDYNINLKTREFTITSTCPGLNSQKSIQKMIDALANIPGVKIVHDAEDKDGIRYVVEFGKIGEARILEGIELAKKVIARRDTFDFGAVERLPDADTNKTISPFMRLTPIQLLEKWCKWRIAIESKVIYNRIVKANTTISRYNLMIVAVDNIDIVTEALHHANSEKYLMAKLKITEDEANIITDLRLKQLKRTEKATLKQKIKEEQLTLKAHKLEAKKPQDGIIRQLEAMHIKQKKLKP